MAHAVRSAIEMDKYNIVNQKYNTRAGLLPVGVNCMP